MTPTTSDESAVTREPCPDCGAEVEIHRDYVPWCPACDWGLQASTQPVVMLSDWIAARFGPATDEEILHRFLDAPTLRMRLTLRRIAAVVIATLVTISAPLFLVSGAYLIVAAWPNLIVMLSGLVLIALGLILRPKRRKDNRRWTTRKEMPTFFAICDRIARAVGVPPIDRVAITNGMTIGVKRSVLRRRTDLTVGLPILALLGDQERVALLSSGITADAVMGSVWVGHIPYAFRSLEELHFSLQHNVDGPAPRNVGAIHLFFARALSQMMVEVVWVVRRSLMAFVWYDQQRTEYVIDGRTAEIAGVEPTLVTIDRAHRGSMVELAAQRAALTKGVVLFDELRRQIRGIPALELQRLRRANQVSGSRTNTMQPPTHFRMVALHARTAAEPVVRITPDESAALERELAAFEERVAQTLVDRHLARLHNLA